MDKIDVSLLIKILNHIGTTRKWQVVDRIRAMFEDDDEPQSDQEMRLDLIFAYCNDRFPDNDIELLKMYVNWMESELLLPAGGGRD